MEKGRRWSVEVADRLASAPVGIICITRDNLRAPWLLFESGAISKPRDGYVCTFLLDVEPSDVEPPLGDFQHTRAVRSDMLRLVQTINNALHVRGEKPLTDGVLDRVFERNWPELELRLQALRESQQKQPERARSDRDILDEILALVRQRPPSAATLLDAALADRLLMDAAGRSPSRARTNRAFVYVLRLEDEPSVGDAIVAAIEKLDGLVTSRKLEGEIECVFLRPAEPDLIGVLARLGARARVVVSRATVFDWSPEEPPAAGPDEESA
jgi:hypothetical protein